jgi:selenocysteine lyase/cysteine desulfurase
LRISPHIYNTKDEIVGLVEELKKLWFFLLFNY